MVTYEIPEKSFFLIFFFKPSLFNISYFLFPVQKQAAILSQKIKQTLKKNSKNIKFRTKE